jgi:hypothetical protein
MSSPRTGTCSRCTTPGLSPTAPSSTPGELPRTNRMAPDDMVLFCRRAYSIAPSGGDKKPPRSTGHRVFQKYKSWPTKFILNQKLAAYKTNIIVIIIIFTLPRLPLTRWPNNTTCAKIGRLLIAHGFASGAAQLVMSRLRRCSSIWSSHFSAITVSRQLFKVRAF